MLSTSSLFSTSMNNGHHPLSTLSALSTQHQQQSPSSAPPTNTNCSHLLTLSRSGRLSSQAVPFECVRMTRWLELCLILVFALLSLITVTANLLIIAAILLVRKLRTNANIMIISLACSDCAVGAFIMPLTGLMHLLQYRWPFSGAACTLFVTGDVMICTCSILHLCAIAIYRYRLITRPLSAAHTRHSTIAAYLAGVWLMGILVSLPAALLNVWERHDQQRQQQQSEQPHSTSIPIGSQQQQRQQYLLGNFSKVAALKSSLSSVTQSCQLSNKLWFQLYATFGSFYIPLIIMLILYGKIYKMAQAIRKIELSQQQQQPRQQPHHHQQQQQQQQQQKQKQQKGRKKAENSVLPNGTITIHNSRQVMQQSGSVVPTSRQSSRIYLNDGQTQNSSHVHFRHSSHTQQKSRAKHSNVQKSKTIRTLGIIMGCFLVCWLPFFLMQVTRAFLAIFKINDESYFPEWLFGFFNWLGYANSLINPIIYAEFNAEFRLPIMMLLRCQWRNINEKIRSAEFASKFGFKPFERSRASKSKHQHRARKRVDYAGMLIRTKNLKPDPINDNNDDEEEIIYL